MTIARRRPLTEILALRARDATELTAVATTVCDAFATRIPFDFACFATTDPSTGLISWAHKSRPLEVGDEEFAAAEYGAPDVNLFAELAGRAEPVGVLSIDTAGDLDSCRRFRDFLVPRFGFTDELRVVFRTQSLVWGALALYRGAGETPFTDDDAKVAESVHGQVAALIQRALFHPRAAAAGPAGAPCVIVVDAADQVRNMTPAAEGRIAELGGWDHGSLPATLLVTAAAARSTPELAVNRAIGPDGAWLVVRATTFAGRGAAVPPEVPARDDVVITVDTAAPGDISALALSARGLSAREQDVAGLVLQGAATKAIAAALHLSPHTVQDHLKSIFGKLAVNSRREMVQQLVLR